MTDSTDRLTIVEFIKAQQAPRVAPVCGCSTAGKVVRGMCATHYDRWVHSTPKELRPKPPRFSRDFWDFVDKQPEGCWVWIGPKNRSGYGIWSDTQNGERGLAHRVSLARLEAPPAASLFACHRCDNPPCVNPAHLYWGTVQDNTRDVMERQGVYNKGIHPSHCGRGHELSGENLRVVGKKQQWKCRTCDNARAREYQRRRRASK